MSMTSDDDDNNENNDKELSRPKEVQPRPVIGLAGRIQQYYRQPDPASLPELFSECWAAGLFRFRNGRANPVTMTFFAAALDATGESGWEGFIDELLRKEPVTRPPARRGLFARLISGNSGPRLEERRNSLLVIAFLSKDREQRPLRYFFNRTSPPATNLAASLAQAEEELAGMRPPSELTHPFQIDQLWAFFYATGDENAVRGVIAIANGDAIAPESELRANGFRREALMQAAAFSLVELAPKQSRISQVIYASMEDYQSAPVYSVLIMALQRAGVARLSFNPDGTTNINFQVPPEWQ